MNGADKPCDIMAPQFESVESNQCVVIDGKAHANTLLDNLRREIQELGKRSIVPGLAVILVGDDTASVMYTATKVRRAQEIGIHSRVHKFPATVTESEVLEYIHRLNADNAINGILVQLPLPNHFNTQALLDTITYEKDVDGFHTYNVGLLNSWQDSLEPCTPQGALMLIKSALGQDISGKKAVVLGRSRIVGRPMVSILIRESCSVLALHSKSRNLQEECRNADIIVSAVGKPQMITKEWVMPGACVIDIGIVKVGDKLYGDVDFESVKQVAGFITPVPGGVGQMTVACLLLNTIRAAYTANYMPWTSLSLSSHSIKEELY